jgi:hypothetical protein
MNMGIRGNTTQEELLEKGLSLDGSSHKSTAQSIRGHSLYATREQVGPCAVMVNSSSLSSQTGPGAERVTKLNPKKELIK